MLQRIRKWIGNWKLPRRHRTRRKTNNGRCDQITIREERNQCFPKGFCPDQNNIIFTGTLWIIIMNRLYDNSCCNMSKNSKYLPAYNIQ